MNGLAGAALGAGSSLFDFGLGQLGSALSAKRQWKYSQKQMNLAHEMEKKNLALQDKYQRQLAEDAASLRKSSLVKAGYSVADPEGTGTVNPTVSGPSTSAGSGFTLPGSDFSSSLAQNIFAIKNAQLTASQTRLNDIQSKYLAKKQEAEIEYTRSKTKEVLETLRPRIDNFIQDIELKKKDLHLKDEQIELLKSQVDNFVAQTEGISIDNKYKDELNSSRINEIDQHVALMIKEGKFKDIENELAQNGILINANWLTQLLAILHQGSGTSLLGDVTSTLSGMLGQLPGALGQVLVSLVNTISSIITEIPSKVINAIKEQLGL